MFSGFARPEGGYVADRRISRSCVARRLELRQGRTMKRQEIPVTAAHIAEARVWLAASVAIALLLLARAANADLHTAHVAYEKQDFKTAYVQFKELAELGQPQAQYALAIMYARGEGVKKSNRAALEWIRKSAEGGSTSGMELLAQSYENGWLGLTPSSAEAKKWYSKAKQGKP